MRSVSSHQTSWSPCSRPTVPQSRCIHTEIYSAIASLNIPAIAILCVYSIGLPIVTGTGPSASASWLWGGFSECASAVSHLRRLYQRLVDSERAADARSQGSVPLYRVVRACSQLDRRRHSFLHGGGKLGLLRTTKSTLSLPTAPL